MISDLRSLDTFKILLDNDECFFAPSLCNFLCAITKNKELLNATNEKALAEENEDSFLLNTKGAQLLKILKTDHEKVEQYCKKHSIIISVYIMGLEYVDEFCTYEQGIIENPFLHILDSLIRAHIDELLNLVNIDLEFVKQFTFVITKDFIESLKISPLIDEWELEKQALTRIQSSKFWYAWKQLTRFHNVFHNFEDLRTEHLKKGEFFKEWQLWLEYKKITNLNNSTGDLYKKELRFYVQQLIYALESLPQKAFKTPTVALLKQSSINDKKCITVRINKDRIQLFICKKEELTDQQEEDMAFEMRVTKGRNRRYELLILLLPNAMGFNITMLYEKLGLTNNKQLDKAISGINEIFRLKTHFRTDDLIVRKKSKIIINDEYIVELIS